MAEKEERILIFNLGDQCAYRGEASVSYLAKNGDKIGTRQELVCHREDNWGANCDDKWCEKCDKKDLVGITRQEAIERMAKALCEKDFGDCGKCMCRNDDECYTVVEDSKWFGLAEAALNALLEE